MPRSLIALLIGLVALSCASAPVATGTPAKTAPLSSPGHAGPADAAAPQSAPVAATPALPEQRATSENASPEENATTADGRSAARLTKARALVTEVARHRGLAETAPLDIRFEDAAAFQQSLARVAAEDKSDPEAERAKWVAFGLAPPDTSPKEIEQKVLGEQVAAFYDAKDKQLHVPIDAPAGAGDQAALEAEVILAHEIEHGLQDEHFPFPDLAAQPDEDQALALKAIYEGDATFVMVAAPASRRGPVDGAALLAAARSLSHLPPAALASMSGRQSSELLQAPRIVRDELLLPYFGGMVLVAELYSRGGYALVDRMFQHPPESSEQILHPEKYLAGERPIAVDAPRLPGGMTQLSRGRMGELGVRTLLEGCLSDAAAALAAEGWGGDAYLVAADPAGALLLEWSTAWDSEAAAERFAAALAQGKRRCFPADLAQAGSSWTLSAGARWSRRGNRLALVRGAVKDEERALLEGLLALPHARSPDAPPLGPLALAPTAEVR